MPELLGNHAIEQAAIAWVMELERAAGRQAVRRVSPVDIESPPQLIEVKAVGKPSLRSDGFLLIELNQLEALRDNPDGYIYVVENVRQGDPSGFRLRIFQGEQLQRLLTRVREHRTYEIPVPVAEYDAAPASL